MIAALPQTATAADLVDQEMVNTIAKVFINCGGLPYAEDFKDAGFNDTAYLTQRGWVAKVEGRKQFTPKGEVQDAYRELVKGY